MAEDINTFLGRWKELVGHIKTQPIHKDHCDTVRTRFKKEKVKLLTENQQDMTMGALLDDMEKELEAALIDAEAMHAQKQPKRTLFSMFDNFMEWMYKIMHGKL
jgi:hypothetical protein